MRADAVRFHVWSYAHLPLYLGIAIAGAGVERIVRLGTDAELHGADGIILATSLAVALLAMTAIGAVGPERHTDGRRVTAHVTLAMMVAAVASFSANRSTTS